MKRFKHRLVGLTMALGLFAVPAYAADNVVSSAAGGWFAADARTVKDTTWEGGVILGGETNLVLQCSPSAWGAAAGGESVTVAYSNETTGATGTIAAKTTAATLDWTPPPVKGTYCLTHQPVDSSGAAVGDPLTARFAVEFYMVEVKPYAGPGTTVSGVYTNGAAVAYVGNKYMVASNAVVDVEFYAIAEAGFLFKTDTGYSSFATNTVTASENPTLLDNPAPVQGSHSGGTTYVFMDGGAMTIAGSGEATSLPQAFDRGSVTSVTIADGITGIGQGFFFYCPNIVTVTGGRDLASVGANAFHLCMSLEAITLDCTQKPEGLDDAVKFVQAYVQGEGWKYIPEISWKGSVATLYGKNDLKDAEWTKIGPASKYKTMEETGYHYFETRIEDGEAEK